MCRRGVIVRKVGGKSSPSSSKTFCKMCFHRGRPLRCSTTKITVSLLLPGTSTAAQWHDLLQSRRHRGPGVYEDHDGMTE